MKKTYKILLSLLAVTGSTLASCSNEGLGDNGEGRVNLVASLNNDVKVISRATGAESTEDLLKDFRLYIYSQKGLIRKYHSLDEFNDACPNGLVLISGSYRANIWAGDSTDASFDHKYFKGQVDFDVTKNSNETVNIIGKIQNTVASVNFPDNLKEVLADAKMTIGTTAGVLEFNYDNAATAKGYYMLPAGVTALTWTLTGKAQSGIEVSRTGTVENAKSATEYQFNVKYDPNHSSSDGGAGITVTVDETTIDVKEDIVLTGAPKISGSGFDITQPMYSESKKFNTLSIYVTTVAELASLRLTCDNATAWENAIGIPGTSNIDLKAIQGTALTNLKNAGIFMPDSSDPEGTNCGAYTDSDGRSGYLYKIILKKDFLNKLVNGSYKIELSATDANGRKRDVTFDLEISDALVITNDATGVRQVSATLNATIAKDEATKVGFEYRKAGSGSWIKVTDNISVNDNSYSVTVTGLSGDTEYEYRAICTNSTDASEFTSIITKSFTTAPFFQLPNAGFEDWQGSSPLLVYVGGSENKFWDSGNHGSATLNKNVTTNDTEIKHSGTYSAKLKSQFVALAGIGKFAAGNLFTGDYLETVVTNGIIGFGRPYTQDDGPRPTKLRGWVKYVSGVVDYEGGDIKKGQQDVGQIYIAFASEPKVSDSYTSYIKVVNTKTKDLFDKNADNIMGYGEIEWNKSTDGEGMIQFEIPIEYTKSGMPKYIMVVASASKYGDYFAGSTGSTMWLDDLELVYE